ncbi:MAG: hypothetical protein HQK53_18515, partial [Oligoflexia bacterium]|nr:hypothetical protein [Oligoflexia bacterium]
MSTMSEDKKKQICHLTSIAFGHRKNILNLFKENHEPTRLEAINELGRIGDIATIPKFFKLVFLDDSDVAYSAITSIATIMERTPLKEKIQLDRIIRQHSSRAKWNNEYEYPLIGTKEFDSINGYGEFAGVILGIISCDSDGHVREEAIKRLQTYLSNETFVFVVLRLNDWVPQVRNSAYSLMEKYLTIEFSDIVFRHLNMIQHLEKMQRCVHVPLINRAMDILLAPNNKVMLLRFAKDKDYNHRRNALRLLSRMPELGIEELTNLFARDRDIVIRKGLLDILLSSKIEWKFLFQNFSQDKHSSIRKIILQLLCDDHSEEAKLYIEKYLCDPWAELRAEARTALKNYYNYEIDYLNFYIDKLSNYRCPKELICAIDELGRLGSKNHTDKLRPFLLDQNKKIIATALNSLGKIDFQGHLNEFINHLKSESVSLSTTVRKIVEKNILAVPVIEIEKIINSDI